MTKLAGLLTGAIATVGLAASAQAADLKGAQAYGTASTMAFGAVDLDQLRKSPLFAIAKAAIAGQAGKMQAEIKTETGFDIIEDPKAVTFFVGNGFEKDDDLFTAVVEAEKFDEKKIVAFATKKGAKFSEGKCAGGATYHEIDGKGGLAFQGKFALIGGKKFLCESLAKKGLSGDLKAAAGKLDLSWTLSAAGLPNAKMLAGAPPQLAKVKWATVNFNLTKGAALKAIAGFKGNKDAAKARNFAKKQLEGFKKSPQAKGAPVNMDNVKIGGAGKEVNLDVTISEQELTALQGMAGGMMGKK